jgi:hypothetical protein
MFSPAMFSNAGLLPGALPMLPGSLPMLQGMQMFSASMFPHLGLPVPASTSGYSPNAMGPAPTSDAMRAAMTAAVVATSLVGYTRHSIEAIDTLP